MKLHLRDTSEVLVEAWNQHFGQDSRVQITSGDILEVSACAIVSPANSFGFMDGGIDLAYSRHFGWGLQSRLRSILREDHGGELPVGQAIVVPTGADDIPYLVCAPTMRVPADVRGTLSAYLAFRATLRAVDRFNTHAARPIETVLCPGLATGVGRIDPQTCAKQMYAAWLGHFEPIDYPSLGMAREVDQRLR